MWACARQRSSSRWDEFAARPRGRAAGARGRSQCGIEICSRSVPRLSRCPTRCRDRLAVRGGARLAVTARQARARVTKGKATGKAVRSHPASATTPGGRPPRDGSISSRRDEDDGPAQADTPDRNLAAPIALRGFAPTGSQPGSHHECCRGTVRAISTPEQFETRLGTLELIIPAPSSETVSDCTELLLGLLRTPSDAGVGASPHRPAKRRAGRGSRWWRSSAGEPWARPRSLTPAMLDTTLGKLAFADRSRPNNHLRVTLILLSIRDRWEL